MRSNHRLWTSTNVKKSFLEFSFVLILCFTAISCGSKAPLNYTPTSELRQEYAYSMSSEHFKVFYNVSAEGNGLMVRGVMQNISRTFAANVTIDIADSIKGDYMEKTHVYKSLGSIKMFSNKPFEFYIPSDEVREISITYEFMPIKEDVFTRQQQQDQPTADPGNVYNQAIRGTIKLPLIKKDKN